MSDLLRDPARLEALTRSELMDSEPEEVFDRLTRLATKLLGAPVATMTLVDDTRQYFKSAVGTAVNQTPLSHSFCQHVVTGGAPLVVTDARLDPRVSENAAIDDLDVIAYCGVPLTDADGNTLGSFCAIEHGPREWTEIEIEILTELAHNIMTELDLRAANRALVAREHETRSIIESAHDAFVALDAAHRIVDWNPAAERLFGWTADEAVGRPASETILPEIGAGWGLERHASAGGSHLPALPIEVSARHRDGRTLEVEVSIARVDTPEGPRFNALVRDIAERRAAQLQREQLARVVESTNDAVITVDLGGTITSWNAGAERLYGYTAEEMIGAPQVAARHTQCRDSDAEALMPRLMAGEHVIERARPRRRRDGSRIYVDLSAAPLRDESGQVIGATSIARDVTDQHRLELDLEESEARFRETFDEAPIGVALVGPNGRWLEVNRALCEIVGYTEAELLALTFQDISHPDDLDADLAEARPGPHRARSRPIRWRSATSTRTGTPSGPSCRSRSCATSGARRCISSPTSRTSPGPRPPSRRCARAGGCWTSPSRWPASGAGRGTSRTASPRGRCSSTSCTASAPCLTRRRSTSSWSWCTPRTASGSGPRSSTSCASASLSSTSTAWRWADLGCGRCRSAATTSLPTPASACRRASPAPPRT